jgi:hypothetical protein
MAEILCSCGLHESLCMNMSVALGFPYMLKVGVLYVFSIVICLFFDGILDVGVYVGEFI